MRVEIFNLTHAWLPALNKLARLDTMTIFILTLFITENKNIFVMSHLLKYLYAKCPRLIMNKNILAFN